MTTDTPAQAAPVMFDRAEAARRLGVTEAWLKTHRDEVPYIQVGRHRRYDQACIDAYINAQRRDPFARSARSRRGTR
jgi:hypothetical protein